MGDGKPVAVDFEIRGFTAGQRDQRLWDEIHRWIPTRQGREGF